MTGNPLSGILSIAFLAAAATAVPANGLVPSPARDRADQDVARLAEEVDRRIDARLAEAKVRPAPPADDAEYLRRVYLDLAGRIPSVAEARAFLDSRRPDRRSRLVKDLLAGPAFANHFTTTWRAALLPRADANNLARIFAPAFEAWLRRQFVDNTPYDRLVRELLTVPVEPALKPPLDVTKLRSSPGPIGFFLARQLQPEDLAAVTTQVFLGVKLECAQCHNHPFAKWTRKQFWETAAFFNGFKRANPRALFGPATEDASRREIQIPNSKRVVQASFLDGQAPRWQDGDVPRRKLADWLTAAGNPYFARAAVNRVWAHFLGAGLVDPIDEMGDENAPSHPEVLDALAEGFVRHGYDLRFLIRAVTATRAYQRSAAGPDRDKTGRLFERMPVRGLTPEQLFDSLAQATGHVDAAPAPERAFLFFRDASPRAEFLREFASPEAATERRPTILQALKLMNGRFIADATSLARSETLAAVADAPFLSTAERVEVLFLATLSRRPRADEAVRFTRYVEERAPAREALADVFWALLNSGEFLLNH
jgi:hypothetical protein